MEEQLLEAKELILAGKQSPIPYYMLRTRMDWATLASYMNRWQWLIKRHKKPQVFKKLSEKTLQKYASLFGISIEELKNPFK